MPKGDKINADNFYSEYHGHHVAHIAKVYEHLRGPDGNRPCVFFAGDSSLDNKYWFNDWGKATNGYESILSPPKMKQDIAFWMNDEAQSRNLPWFALNTSVEASALIDRSIGVLLAQDKFIQDNIRETDTLIVSVGGNDIALKPTAATIANMLALVYFSTESWVQSAKSCQCGKWSCGKCTFRPLGLNYFIDLFSNKVRDYVERLVSKHKPKRVIICMIYFPQEQKIEPCWADPALGALGYNRSPSKLQRVIETVFHLATQNIQIEGTEVVAFPLFKVLDGKNPDDYRARVEPSPLGGEKMAKALTTVVETPLNRG